MLLAVVLLLCACAVMAVVSVVAYNAVAVSALAVSLAAENADAVGRCWRNVCRCCCWC